MLLSCRLASKELKYNRFITREWSDSVLVGMPRVQNLARGPKKQIFHFSMMLFIYVLIAQ